VIIFRRQTFLNNTNLLKDQNKRALCFVFPFDDMSEHDAATPKSAQFNPTKFKKAFRPQPVTTGFAHEIGDFKAEVQHLSTDYCHDEQGAPSQIAKNDQPKQRKGWAANLNSKRVHFSA
jgi:hypothetical protein